MTVRLEMRLCVLVVVLLVWAVPGWTNEEGSGGDLPVKVDDLPDQRPRDDVQHRTAEDDLKEASLPGVRDVKPTRVNQRRTNKPRTDVTPTKVKPTRKPRKDGQLARTRKPRKDGQLTRARKPRKAVKLSSSDEKTLKKLKKLEKISWSDGKKLLNIIEGTKLSKAQETRLLQFKKDVTRAENKRLQMLEKGANLSRHDCPRFRVLRKGGRLVRLVHPRLRGLRRAVNLSRSGKPEFGRFRMFKQMRSLQAPRPYRYTHPWFLRFKKGIRLSNYDRSRLLKPKQDKKFIPSEHQKMPREELLKRVQLIRCLGGRGTAWWPANLRPSYVELYRSMTNQTLQQDSTRVKRNVQDSNSGLNLPPMASDEDDKKKKKKKKKKKRKGTTQEPTARTIQTKSKKHRIYLESDELALKQGGVVRGMSDEIDKLLQEVDDEEDFTPPPLKMPTKRGYIDVPMNWQNRPSWRPPTRPPLEGMQRRSVLLYTRDVVTIAPEVQSESQAPGGDTEWKKYNHPVRGHEKLKGIELKPPPEDWPEPTHPADGLYDWHKSQFKRAPRTAKPYGNFPTYSGNHHNPEEQWTQWPTFTYPPSWQHVKFSRSPRRFSRGFIPYTSHTTPWSWAIPAEEETAMLRSSNMWQTRSWIPSVQPQREHGDMASNPEEHHETHQHSYNYSPQHAAWQSSAHEHHPSSGLEQSHQQGGYHNYTNYFSQYYQNSYRRLANKTAATFSEQGHHYQVKDQVAGHYQSHYSVFKNPDQQQTRIRPPSYYHHMIEGLRPSVGPLSDNGDFLQSDPRPKFEVPYRAHDEYAGNDRDLRAPLPSLRLQSTLPRNFSFYPATRWPAYRFRKPMPLLRKRGPQSRHRLGGRSAGQFSIFGAPLKHEFFNSTPGSFRVM